MTDVLVAPRRRSRPRSRDAPSLDAFADTGRAVRRPPGVLRQDRHRRARLAHALLARAARDRRSTSPPRSSTLGVQPGRHGRDHGDQPDRARARRHRRACTRARSRCRSTTRCPPSQVAYVAGHAEPRGRVPRDRRPRRTLGPTPSPSRRAIRQLVVIDATGCADGRARRLGRASRSRPRSPRAHARRDRPALAGDRPRRARPRSSTPRAPRGPQGRGAHPPQRAVRGREQHPHAPGSRATTSASPTCPTPTSPSGCSASTSRSSSGRPRAPGRRPDAARRRALARCGRRASSACPGCGRRSRPASPDCSPMETDEAEEEGRGRRDGRRPGVRRVAAGRARDHARAAGEVRRGRRRRAHAR